MAVSATLALALWDASAAAAAVPWTLVARRSSADVKKKSESYFGAASL